MLDQDFLLGDTQRGARFMLEYEKVEHLLAAWVRSTHGLLRLGPGEGGRDRSARPGL
jgi:hypothetical protein